MSSINDSLNRLKELTEEAINPTTPSPGHLEGCLCHRCRMSKKNITKQEDVGKKVQLTFETDKGHYTYEYSGSSVRAIKRGTDPANLSGGRLIHWQKKEK